MIQVERVSNCGNSPKNLFLERLMIALAERDTDAVLDRVAEGIDWTIVGNERVSGKAELAERLAVLDDNVPVKLTMSHVLTHGKAGFVNGTFEYLTGRRQGFCYVFEFTSAKGACVRRIISYVIEM